MLNGLAFTWSWNLLSLLAILVICALYGLGLRSVWGERDQQARPGPLRLLSFGMALLLLVLALLTPVNTIARMQLFSVHMAQLIVLTTICMPLLLLACTDAMYQPVLRHPLVRNLVRSMTHPLVASMTYNLVFIAWHLPVFFTLAQANPWLYQVEVLTILLVGLINWWPLIGPVGSLRGLSYPLKMLYVFADGLPLEIFAFLLVYSGVVIYPHYVVPAQIGFTAYPDQAIAGALLMLPGLVDLLVMSPLFFRWLGQIDRQARLDDESRMEQFDEDKDGETEGEQEIEDLQSSRELL